MDDRFAPHAAAFVLVGADPKLIGRVGFQVVDDCVAGWAGLVDPLPVPLSVADSVKAVEKEKMYVWVIFLWVSLTEQSWVMQLRDSYLTTLQGHQKYVKSEALLLPRPASAGLSASRLPVQCFCRKLFLNSLFQVLTLMSRYFRRGHIQYQHSCLVCICWFIHLRKLLHPERSLMKLCG